MAKPSFTPGPWQWWTSNSWRRLTAHNLPGGQYEREGNVICPIVARDGHPDLSISETDMAVISAAPEMHEALARILPADMRATIAKHHASDCGCNYCFASAALAKAEGRS